MTKLLVRHLLNFVFQSLKGNPFNFMHEEVSIQDCLHWMTFGANLCLISITTLFAVIFSIIQVPNLGVYLLIILLSVVFSLLGLTLNRLCAYWLNVYCCGLKKAGVGGAE